MHADFARVIGGVFSTSRCELTLHEVSDLSERHGTSSFSILFRGSSDEPLEQGMHALHHGELGELELFLVPVGERDGARDYEAVFSLIVETTA